jgi:hypothetical protein
VLIGQSLLPALEGATALLMNLSMDPEADFDGRLSIDVAKALVTMFVKHAAFLKIYSSYILQVRLFSVMIV